MRGRLTIAALGVLLAACQREAIPELALACQTTKCNCVPATVTYPARAEPVPVQWHPNGDAYCPEGYVLRPVEKKRPPF